MTPTRIRSIEAQLETSAAEYLQARERLEHARVEFEVAREKLGGIKRLAGEILNNEDWDAWQKKHTSVRFVAVPIGETIIRILADHAAQCAYLHLRNKTPFSPSMTLQEIANVLEGGGYDFRSTSPLREVNAALMQLKGVAKPVEGKYEIEDAEEFVTTVRNVLEESKKK